MVHCSCDDLLSLVLAIGRAGPLAARVQRALRQACPELAGIVPVLFLFADRLRILRYFAAFCRAILLMLFRIRAIFLTLDQHMEVRILRGAAKFFQ